jgi:Transposase DDE domain
MISAVVQRGYAAYGYCASHSRYFWGFRLYLLCASDGMPIAFELAAANVPEREVAAELLRRVELEGYTVIADKGFADEEFEALMAELGAIFMRPDRKDEKPRFGKLGHICQWIESIIDTLKGQLPRAARRAHHARAHDPHRPTPPRPRRRHLAQQQALGSRTNRHTQPQPHRLRPLNPTPTESII